MNVWYAVLPILLGISFGHAFGHGLGTETVPVTLGDKNATLTITINPPIFDLQNNEHQILLSLTDLDSGSEIRHVMYTIDLAKNDKQIFNDKFYDDSGSLYLDTKTTDAKNITIRGTQDQTLGWTKYDNFNPLLLEGPIFAEGGLYKFHIQVVAADYDTKPTSVDAALSLAQKTLYTVNAESKKPYRIGITTYYDKIKNFEFSPQNRLVSFEMPFDWSAQNIGQQNIVVHEELHIPKTFGEMLVTKYDVTVNGIQIPEHAVTIDDYSDVDNRIVHIVLNKEELNTISAEASKTPNVAKFTILPSMGVAFPLSANTSDMKYGVEMSWDPQIITPGQSTRFYIGLSELFSDKKQRPATFDFVLKQNDVELFRKAISGQTNVEKGNFVDYTFSPENVGTIVILVEKINGNAQSSVNFVATVSQKAQTFPIRLTSVSENKTPGKYYVDLTWVPKDLPITEAAEFIMTIYDKESGLPVGQASYDFVLIKGNSEIYRKSGLAASGGSFEGFKFSSGDVGNLMLRIEKINGSDEFVEIPITVTPEFPTGTLLVLVVTLSMIVIFSKKLGYSFSSS